MKKKTQKDTRKYEKNILGICISIIILSFLLLGTIFVTFWWLFLAVLLVDLLYLLGVLRLSNLVLRFLLFLNVSLAVLGVLYVLMSYRIWFS